MWLSNTSTKFWGRGGLSEGWGLKQKLYAFDVTLITRENSWVWVTTEAGLLKSY